MMMRSVSRQPSVSPPARSTATVAAAESLLSQFPSASAVPELCRRLYKTMKSRSRSRAKRPADRSFRYIQATVGRSPEPASAFGSEDRSRGGSDLQANPARENDHRRQDQWRRRGKGKPGLDASETAVTKISTRPQPRPLVGPGGAFSFAAGQAWLIRRKVRRTIRWIRNRKYDKACVVTTGLRCGLGIVDPSAGQQTAQQKMAEKDAHAPNCLTAGCRFVKSRFSPLRRKKFRPTDLFLDGHSASSEKLSERYGASHRCRTVLKYRWLCLAAHMSSDNDFSSDATGQSGGLPDRDLAIRSSSCLDVAARVVTNCRIGSAPVSRIPSAIRGWCPRTKNVPNN